MVDQLEDVFVYDLEKYQEKEYAQKYGSGL